MILSFFRGLRGNLRGKQLHMGVTLHESRDAFLLVLMACAFVLEAETGKCLQQGGCLGITPATTYVKPYFMTYINHSLMIVLLVPYLLKHLRHLNYEGPLPESYLWRPCLLLSLVFFVGDYSWYLALPHTSVAEGTAFTDSVCVFSAMLSFIFLGEVLTLQTVSSVFSVLAGLAILLWSDLNERGLGAEEVYKHTTANLLAINTALCYAIYEVGFAKAVHKDDTFLTTLTACGMVSFWNIVMMPFGLLVVASPLFSSDSWLHETFVLPSPLQFQVLLLNACCSSAFVVLMLLCVLLTTPTQVAIGCALEIPIAAVADIALRGHVLSPVQCLGATAIVAGFVMITKKA